MILVEKELFVIPANGKYILYVPTARTAVAVNDGIIRDLQACIKTGYYPAGPIRDSLFKAGILADSALAHQTQNICTEGPYKPTQVTLCPTSDCGLRCVYCYASAGSTQIIMEYCVAVAAIDLIVDNAISAEQKTVDVTFHGGGEPFYGKADKLVRAVVAYAKDQASKNGLKLTVTCTSNGVLSQRQLAWIKSNLTRFNLSCDGPPSIQDLQRPLKTGGETSAIVESTISYLERHKINYGIRSTITKQSVAYLHRIVDYFHDIAPSADIHIEPLFACGRCSVSGAEAPEPEQFISAFLSARKHAMELGINLYNSGSDLSRCSTRFCGATRGNFCVTPWGDVTSCYEVTLPTDARASLFFFGHYDPEHNAFSFDDKRLAQLRRRGEQRLRDCADCFMKHSCSGDCIAKAELLDRSASGFRCQENRMIGLAKIIEAATHEECLKTGGDNHVQCQ